jgi:hypothetical protein
MSAVDHTEIWNIEHFIKQKTNENKRRDFSQQANYIDRATAACWRN